jgi:hypothetical protein
VLLILATFCQSVLTVACGLDDLKLGVTTAVSAEAVTTLPDDGAGVSQGICAQCGGLVTPGGCCAHGTGLSQRIPDLFAPQPSPWSTLSHAPLIASNAPAEHFRPPIPV